MQISITTDLLKSLSKLSNTEQKRTHKTIMAIARNDKSSGLRPHKIQHPSTAIFSYSVNRDIRIIVHRKENQMTLLHVGHHDAAYAWVERRKFVSTGSELKIIVPYEEVDNTLAEPVAEAARPSIEMLEDLERHKRELKQISDDDEALAYIEQLPLDERSKTDLLEYVVEIFAKYAIAPRYSIKALKDDHELAEALTYPLDLWRVFLHPRQAEIVNLPHDSSQVITGGPGTGKTVCLVHRMKQVINFLTEDQKVLLVTYKSQLSGYILEMMRKIGVDESKVLIVDVNDMNVANVVNITSQRPSTSTFDTLDPAWKQNCFVISANTLHYYYDRLVELAHLFVDEYQDFRVQQLDIIDQLNDYVPSTICVDYSQAIYRPPRRQVAEAVSTNDTDIVELSYCYRLNDQVIQRLKKVLLAAQVVANYARGTRFQFEMITREARVIDSLFPAVFGSPPTLFTYESQEDLHTFLTLHVSEMCKSFEKDEFIVTTFFPGVELSPREDVGYQKELFPEPIQEYYRYIYTLKGLEWKAGVIILDEVICSLLNLNRSLFVNQAPDGFRGSKDNVKRMFNLLYVALSRFRDYLCICYPAKYSLIVDGIFK